MTKTTTRFAALLGAVMTVPLFVMSAAASAAPLPAVHVAIPHGTFDARGMTKAQAIRILRADLPRHSAAGMRGVQPLDSRSGNNLPSAPNCDKDQNAIIDNYAYHFAGYQQQWTRNDHAPYEVNWYAVSVPAFPYGMVDLGASTASPCYNTW